MVIRNRLWRRVTVEYNAADGGHTDD